MSIFETLGIRRRRGMYLSRTICEVLDEMRTCNKTQNYSYLAGLIEEAQTMVNRMEAKLCQVADIKEVEKGWHEWKEKKKAMEKEKDEAGKLKEALSTLSSHG